MSESQSQSPEADIDAEVEQALAEGVDGKSVEQAMEEAASAELPAASAAASEAGDAGDPLPGPSPRGVKRGRITEVRDREVFVELGGVEGKHTGVVPLEQFERAPAVGHVMDFVLDRVDEEQGLVYLSREGAVARATWARLEPGVAVEARVTGSNKGGLELELLGGIQAFMPASQIEHHPVNDLESYVGSTLTAEVTDVEKRKKRVVLSRRQHLDTLRRRRFEALEEGAFVEGTVSKVVDYGAFVDLGDGVEGLIHVRDLSYSRKEKPGDVVQPGDAVTVKVLQLDAERGRIGLGLKQTHPDPWESVEVRYQPGQDVDGRVVRVEDFGAFVELEHGVEGLLPTSEMSWRRVTKPGEIVAAGDAIRLRIMRAEPEQRRITLSLKQSQGDPWIGAEHKYARDTVVEGRVVRLVDFGAFVELEPGVEGLVHISELAEGRVSQVSEAVQPEEHHRFRVLEVDEENRRLRLSLRAADKPLDGPSAEERAQASKDAQKKAKRQQERPLKGGMDVGGIGLGDLKL